MIVQSSQLAQFSLERILEMIDPNKRMESTDAVHHALAANWWLIAMTKKPRDFLFLWTYFFRHYEIRCSQGLKMRKWVARSIVWHCSKGCRVLRGLVVVTKGKPALFFAHIMCRFRHGDGTKAVGMKRVTDTSYTNIWYRNNFFIFPQVSLVYRSSDVFEPWIDIHIMGCRRHGDGSKAVGMNIAMER